MVWAMKPSRADAAAGASRTASEAATSVLARGLKPGEPTGSPPHSIATVRATANDDASPAPLVLGHHRNVALLAGELVANRLRARPDLRLILPTGHTPLGMYEALRAHSVDGSLEAEHATLFQLDEYLGLPPDDERSYRAYLRRELSGIELGAFHGLDGSASYPDAECARHQALL